VERLLAIRRHDRQGGPVPAGPSTERLVIALPDEAPRGLDPISRLELRQQDGGQQVRRQVAGAEVGPRVLVNLAAEEAAAVRPSSLMIRAPPSPQLKFLVSWKL